MPSLAVAVAVVFAALLAFVGARSLARGLQRPEALDDTLGGLRKIHIQPTPRIGGIAVASGLAIGAVINWMMDGGLRSWLLVFVCIAPAFIWGLIEDLSKRGAVLPRLVLPGLAGALGFILLDARITQLSVPGLDELLTVHAFAFLFTVFAVTGVTHAFNVIDGLNGLSGSTGLLASIGLAIVAFSVGDAFVFSVASILAASIAGFLFVNYPAGRIFLGDGGAYLVGLLLAELSVLLVQRNSEVSPWFPLVLLAYPIWETLFSMYRRKSRGYSTAHADALHLHQLVYRRLVRWRGFSSVAADKVARNSVASLVMWILPFSCLVTALALWNHSFALQLAAAGFVVLYCILYRTLARFRLPKWAVVRARPATGGESTDVDVVGATRGR